ncbi:flagellar hook assembly protein FlgD [Asticcacaulis solisilvae]|uniref:flagellar hook assembly protein FlgD n=1 Tax=Asticcacaulis solisilvae TaxID=1217274 RepID=UPI003FD71CA8
MTSVTSATSTTATGSTSTSGNGITADYSTFLNLLTAQIQNQDPLSPMDTTQWTQQLVQYSQVEQALKTNDYLKTIASNSGDTMSNAVSYIGKTVQTSDATATLKNGSADWNYNTADDAASVTLKVTDSKGNVLYTETNSDVSSGDHSFSWDGKTSAGKTETSGDYTLTVTAKDSNGSAVTTTTGVTGTVNSASTASDGTVQIDVNGTLVPLSSVTKVS